MMNLGEINFMSAETLIMRIEGSREYYTLAQIKSQELPECMVERCSISKTVKNLATTFNEWRGLNGRAAYIQVSE